MLLAAALGATVAAVFLAIVELAVTYRRLPQRMPFHFDIAGKPNSFGPPWLFAAIMLGTLAALGAGLLYALTTPQAAPGAVPLAAAICFLAWVQHLVLQAATSTDLRLRMGRFWPAIITLLVVTLVPAFLQSR